MKPNVAAKPSHGVYWMQRAHATWNDWVGKYTWDSPHFTLISAVYCGGDCAFTLQGNQPIDWDGEHECITEVGGPIDIPAYPPKPKQAGAETFTLSVAPEIDWNGHPPSQPFVPSDAKS
jgi:hypothetical protein